MLTIGLNCENNHEACMLVLTGSLLPQKAALQAFGLVHRLSEILGRKDRKAGKDDLA
jgi:hypothetical protein